MKSRIILLLATLIMPSLVLASVPQKMNCTLSPVEQKQDDRELYDSGLAIAFKVDLSKGTKRLSIGLQPRDMFFYGKGGQKKTVTYDFALGASPDTQVIEIEFSEIGYSMDTNFGSFSSTFGDETKKQKVLLSSSVMYKLPDDRLAIAVLVCQ